MSHMAFYPLTPFSKSNVLIVLLCIVVSSPLLQAEEVRIGKVPFQVDGIEQIDQATVRLTVGPHVKIVAKQAVQQEVLQLYFSDKELLSTLSAAQLEKLFQHLLQQKQIDTSAKIFSSIVRYAALEDKDLLDLVKRIESLPGIYKVFREGLPNAVDAGSEVVQEAVLYLVLKLGLSDSSWVRRNFLKLISNHSQLFELKLEELFEQAVRSEDNLKSEQITKLAAVLFGRQNSLYRKLARFGKSFQDITAASRSGSIDRLHSTLKQTRQDEEFRELFGELVVSVFHTQAKQRLSAGNPQQALLVLSQLGEELRTPSTFEIIRQALRKLSPQVEIQSNRLIRQMMQEVVASDPESKSLYVALIEKQIDLHVHHFHFRRAENALKLLLTLRGDPNAANDALRIKIAHRYVERGSIQEADRLIQDLASGLGLKNKILLLYRGYYVNRPTLFALIVIPLLLFALAYIRRKAALVQTLQSQSFERDALSSNSSDDDEPQRGFSYNVVKRGLSPRMYEYVGLLRTFDLDAEADMKTIKAAYRAAVKSVHPDINPNVTPAEKEKFVQYTSAYEKILELRRSLGFSVD